MNARYVSSVLLAAAFAAGASCSGDGPTSPQPVCSFTISPASASFAAAGGGGAVTLTTAAGCSWNSTASGTWITVTSGGSGSGPGTIAYAVAQNAAPEARNGNLTIGGQIHAIAQQGRPATACTYELSPNQAEFTKDAGSGTFAVTAPEGCAWTATSNAVWVSVTSGNQGAGDGTVSFAVARNVEVADRAGAVTVADRTFSVWQSGDVGNCEYSVTPVAFDVCMPASSVAVTVTTLANCPWTAEPGTSWLTVPSGPSNRGPGVVTIAFSDNYDAPRDGIVMIRWPTLTAGQNVRLAQAGCLYAVSRSDISFGPTGGSGSVDVFQQSVPNSCGGPTQDRCIWTAVSDVPWITITSPMPRSGDNPVNFIVAENDATAPRVGRITVRDKVIIINQAGR